MHAVGVEELSHLPFVRHQVAPATVRGGWRSGGAAALLIRRPVGGVVRDVLTGFGPDADLAALLDDLAAEVAPPDRVLLTSTPDTVPSAWPVSGARPWHWMRSHGPFGPVSPDVVEVEDAGEISALLDEAAPDSMARPGQPGIETWLGLREAGRLVGVGAVVRQPDGTGHLRAVTIAADARGRGLGRTLSVGLSVRAMADSGTVTLGVHTDNEPALRTYRRLGYEVVHTFATSGPVTPAA